jgi:hypothetical protein
MRSVVLGEASSAPGVDMIEHMNCFIELCVFRKKSAVELTAPLLSNPASGGLSPYSDKAVVAHSSHDNGPSSQVQTVHFVLPPPLVPLPHAHTTWVTRTPVPHPSEWAKQTEQVCSHWFNRLGSDRKGQWGRELTGQWNAKSHRTSISKRVFYREQTPDATAKAFSSRVSPSSSAPRPPTALIIIGAAPVSEYSQRVSRFNTRRFAHIYGPNAFIILVEATANKLMPSDYPEVDVFSR